MFLKCGESLHPNWIVLNPLLISAFDVKPTQDNAGDKDVLGGSIFKRLTPRLTYFVTDCRVLLLVVEVSVALAPQSSLSSCLHVDLD